MRISIVTISGNISLNFLLKTVLSKEYEVITAADTIHGFFELKSNSNVKLILLDIDNNIKESAEFIKHLKSSSLYKNKNIFILHSQPINEEMTPLFETGNFTFFEKPFDPSKIKEKIDALNFEERIAID